MREAEFDQLLDVVRATIEVDEHDVFVADDGIIVLPIAANDNEGAWPTLPFPSGWIASC